MTIPGSKFKVLVLKLCFVLLNKNNSKPVIFQFIKISLTGQRATIELPIYAFY